MYYVSSSSTSLFATPPQPPTPLAVVAGNVPQELRDCPQWMLWRYSPEAKDGRDVWHKVPCSAQTGYARSPVDPVGWASFAQCMARYQTGEWAGVGFCLSPTDPYTIIDLDDAKGDAALFAVQRRIFDTMTSYSEHSPGGRGLHIWVKATVENARSAGVEIYSRSQFITVTGNRYGSYPAVEERQALIDKLRSEITEQDTTLRCGRMNFATVHVSAPMIEDDDAVLTHAHNARNGGRFAALWRGEWQELGYPSQSEADFALFDMLAFYTDSHDQVRRLFLRSGLGQREKATQSRYLNGMLARAYDRKPPPIDQATIEAVLNALRDDAGSDADAV